MRGVQGGAWHLPFTHGVPAGHAQLRRLPQPSATGPHAEPGAGAGHTPGVHDTLPHTFAGIRPASAPAFVVAELAGGLAAIALARWWYADEPAPELVLPHDRSDAP